MFATDLLFFKWTSPCIFLFNFDHFRQNFTEKTLGIRTRVVEEEGKCADHETTTVALNSLLYVFQDCIAEWLAA